MCAYHAHAPCIAVQVGVGAFVVNSSGQVLVVQERSGVLRGRGVWKMPTGLVAAGEDLTAAAERELLEETVRRGWGPGGGKGRREAGGGRRRVEGAGGLRGLGCPAISVGR